MKDSESEVLQQKVKKLKENLQERKNEKEELKNELYLANKRESELKEEMVKGMQK